MPPTTIIPRVCSFALLSLVPLHANGIARFDIFAEGAAGPVVSEGGLTFSNLDNGFSPVPGNFVIDDGSTTLIAYEGFTSPNALGFLGWQAGTRAAFTPCRSFDISTAQSETDLSMDFLLSEGQASNSIVLERYLGSTLVASSTHPLPTASPFAVLHISLSGPAFDRVHVRGIGPGQNGGFVGCLDNVVVGDPNQPGSGFCSADGVDPSVLTACPCGNSGALGHGCANSSNAAGADLAATGTTSPDTVVLHATGMPATATAIFLQGDGLDDTVFGDGVRCIGGTLVRLKARASISGAGAFPVSGDNVTLSTRGGVSPGSGVVRYYQTCYRNSAAAFCTPDTFNVSAGWQVTW